MILLIFLLTGLVFGSFIGAFSWRILNGKSIRDGRSTCPECESKIHWYDNIPVVSYILLRGKCRSCNKKISLRYPLIEVLTGVIFLVIGITYFNCFNLLVIDSPLCMTKYSLSNWALPYFGVIAVILITIFITDWEHQIIPDELVFAFFLSVFLVTFITNDQIWEKMFAGFSAAIFLLSLNLLTKGKGMGMGDAKLAIPIGIVFGISLTIVWMLTSFLLGSVIGLMLIAGNKARFGKQIAFGPFLILSYFIILIFGGLLENIIFLT